MIHAYQLIHLPLRTGLLGDQCEVPGGGGLLQRRDELEHALPGPLLGGNVVEVSS